MKTLTIKQAILIYSVLKQLKFNEARLDWFVSRNLKKLQNIIEEAEEKKYELQLQHASVDEKGNVIREGENAFLKFTPEKEIALNKAVKELYAKEVSFEPYELHADLLKHESIVTMPVDIKLLFEGILMPELTL
jgi:hypothetical protein